MDSVNDRDGTHTHSSGKWVSEKVDKMGEGHLRNIMKFPNKE